MENILPDELPPEWMWHLEHELDDWFKEIERKRQEKYGASNTGSEEKLPGEMVKNEFAPRRGGKYAR